MLGYLTDLTLLMSHKLRGRSIEGHPSIERLVEIRTVIEKIRPIDQKLKYQIDKLIKTAACGTAAANDPLQFKPNPDNLVGKVCVSSKNVPLYQFSIFYFQLEDDEEDDDEGGASGSKANAVYRPPKLAAMHYGMLYHC